MRVVPPVHHDQGSRVVVFDANLCDVVIAVGLTTFTITFGIFFALHSPGELETEEGFRQLPTISLTGCYSPANFIFTGGMHLLSVLLFFLFHAIFLLYESKIHRAYTLPKSGMTTLLYDSSLFWNKVLWFLGMFSVVLLSVTGSVPVTVSGDVHSPAAFFFFFCFILHIHIFFFKVAHKELLVGGITLTLLKIATFSSLLLPFLMLVIGEVMLLVGDTGSIYVFMGVNIHVIVEYVVTIALAIYIYSFRNEMQSFSLNGHMMHENEGSVDVCGSSGSGHDDDCLYTPVGSGDVCQKSRNKLGADDSLSTSMSSPLLGHA